MQQPVIATALSRHFSPIGIGAIIARKLFGGKPVQAYFEVSDVFVCACMFVDVFIPTLYQ